MLIFFIFLFAVCLGKLPARYDRFKENNVFSLYERHEIYILAQQENEDHLVRLCALVGVRTNVEIVAIQYFHQYILKRDISFPFQEHILFLIPFNVHHLQYSECMYIVKQCNTKRPRSFRGGGLLG